MAAQPYQAHQPSWHLLATEFGSVAESGITPPQLRPGAPVLTQYAVVRTAANLPHSNRIVFTRQALRLVRPTRGEPDGYEWGKVPRKATFPAGNVHQITADPRMPAIDVECEVTGFDPATTPIHWRLECGWTHCRYEKQEHVYRYLPRSESVRMEWQGRARSAKFRLFADPRDANVDYDYNPPAPNAPVLGGHGMLSVAAKPAQGEPHCIDTAHLLIGGTNPTKDKALAFLDQLFKDRNVNLLHMMKAIYGHESGFKQFIAGKQTQERMKFYYHKYHSHPAPQQPDCSADFVHPPDPANFPNMAFDFGVGISQYTILPGRTLSGGVAWDWRVNALIGVNLFLTECAKKSFNPEYTWRKWARVAYMSYNGGYKPQGNYSEAAQDYAALVTGSAEGEQVEDEAIPSAFHVNEQTADIPDPVPDPGDAPVWPPFASSATP